MGKKRKNPSKQQALHLVWNVVFNSQSQDEPEKEKHSNTDITQEEEDFINYKGKGN